MTEIETQNARPGTVRLRARCFETGRVLTLLVDVASAREFVAEVMRSPGAEPPAGPADDPTLSSTARIRAWAMANGLPVAAQGRLPAALVARYVDEVGLGVAGVGSGT